MKRLLALTATALTAAAIPISTAPAKAAGRGCIEPVAERAYEANRLVYRLAVDAAGCDWWDGSPIQLEATLDRVDGQSGHGSASFVVCSTALAEAPAGPGADKSAATPARSGDCDVEVDMEHPPVEAAHYHGEISYPWHGARRTASFTALCAPPTGCVDLPAGATTGVLGNLADVYDRIGGGDDQG